MKKRRTKMNMKSFKSFMKSLKNFLKNIGSSVSTRNHLQILLVTKNTKNTIISLRQKKSK